MAKEKVKTKTSGEKKPIHLMRERHGGMSDDFKKYYKEFTKTRKVITERLKQGSATIPELAERCQLPSGTVIWHVMAMKKYKEAVEGELHGDYYTYSLVGKE